MRIKEITEQTTEQTIRPKSPMSPAQARINGLKNNVEQGRQQLQAERERQRSQRDAERLRKQQQA
jgi:hypothetical protein